MQRRYADLENRIVAAVARYGTITNACHHLNIPRTTGNDAYYRAMRRTRPAHLVTASQTKGADDSLTVDQLINTEKLDIVREIARQLKAWPWSNPCVYDDTFRDACGVMNLDVWVRHREAHLGKRVAVLPNGKLLWCKDDATYQKVRGYEGVQ